MRSTDNAFGTIIVHLTLTHTHTHTYIHMHMHVVVFMLAICCNRQKIYKLTYDRGAKADKSMLDYRVSDIGYRTSHIGYQISINQLTLIMISQLICIPYIAIGKNAHLFIIFLFVFVIVFEIHLLYVRVYFSVFTFFFFIFIFIVFLCYWWYNIFA